jgi:glutamate/tyrosine decarboxylase-like PLP-dependent enzyme
MNAQLDSDRENLAHLLEEVARYAAGVLSGIDHLPVAVPPPPAEATPLPARGCGASEVLRLFDEKYRKGMPASAGPRFFGFVVGGNTPAALAGDWLAAVYDAPTIGSQDSAAPQIEHETIAMLRQLFGLSPAQFGSFVSGATMANFVGLALARQWAARRLNINVAADGLYGLPPVPVLSAAPHSSVYKAMAMLGMGRKTLLPVATEHDREAIDVAALERALTAQSGPCIVVASAGTVNTGDFDDLEAILALRRRFPFWLHVDAAFGAFAACSPRFRHLVAALEGADSITADAHKWLNVPYDSAMQFTRHRDLQIEVFQNGGAYLAPIAAEPDFVHVTPENSRRLRALPAWFSLLAYGAEGYRDIVENSCAVAGLLSEKIERSERFRLLAPTRFNCVCFTLRSDEPTASAAEVARYIAALRDSGKTFMTQTTYKGQPGIRAAFCNWRTTPRDIEISWQAMLDCLEPERR